MHVICMQHLPFSDSSMLHVAYNQNRKTDIDVVANCRGSVTPGPTKMPTADDAQSSVKVSLDSSASRVSSKTSKQPAKQPNAADSLALERTADTNANALAPIALPKIPRNPRVGLLAGITAKVGTAHVRPESTERITKKAKR